MSTEEIYNAKGHLAAAGLDYSSIYSYEREDGRGTSISFNEGADRIALLNLNSSLIIYSNPITDNTEFNRRTYIEGTNGATKLRTIIDSEEPEPLPVYWDFRSAVRVWDAGQLYDAACKRAIEEKGNSTIISDACAIEDLGTRDAPDIAACLIMLLDPGSLPGCNIEESAAESVDVE